MTKEALKSAIEFAEYCLEELDLSHMASNQAKRLVQKSKEALAKPEQERCVGCEACIDTACGRDECPKGWPKAVQPEQEPVAWMDKENHDVIVSAKDWDNIDPLWYWMYRPLYTTPQPAQKPLTDEEIGAILEGVNAYGTRLYTFARAIEAAHGIKGEA